MTTQGFCERLTQRYGYKGNSIIKLDAQIEITYRYYDEEYQCPSYATDLVHSIELLGMDDFELQLDNGVVHSTDITEIALGSFYTELVKLIKNGKITN